MTAMGLFQHNWDLSARDHAVHPWSAEPNTDWEARKMATYGAMVDRMDQSIGRLIAELKRLDQFVNTLIMFVSDNGGCAEFMAEDGWAKFFPDTTHDRRQIQMGNRPDVAPGGPLRYQSYDQSRANVLNAPFCLFKHYVHEGGISTPLVAHWPKGFEARATAHAACHVINILTTILEVAGAPYLNDLGGHEIQPAQGQSLLDLFQGTDWARDEPIFWEHEGNSAIRLNQFRLVRQHGHDWEFYDMEADRTELNNLAGAHAVLETDLKRQYQGWADGSGVMDWDRALPKLVTAWQI